MIYPFLCTQGHKVATAPTLSLYKVPLFVRLGSHCNAIFKRRDVTASKRYWLKSMRQVIEKISMEIFGRRYLDHFGVFACYFILYNYIHAFSFLSNVFFSAEAECCLFSNQYFPKYTLPYLPKVCLKCYLG